MRYKLFLAEMYSVDVSPDLISSVWWHRGVGQALRAVWLVSGLRPVVWCAPAPRGGSRSLRASFIGFCYKFGSWLRTEYGGYRPNGL